MEPEPTPAPEPTPTPTPAPEPTPTTGKWYDGVDETILKDPILSPFLMENGDISKDLLKSYVHAQRSVGKKRIAVPDKNTTPEEFRGILNELGLPTDKESYKIEKGADSKVDDEFLTRFQEKAFEVGILPQQAKQLLEWQEQIGLEDQKAYEAQQEKAMTDAQETLKKTWGQDYQKNIDRASMAVHQFAGSKEMAEAIIDSDLGNDPQFLDLMSKVASALDEDKFDRNAVPSHYMDKVTAERRINEIQSDINGPYYNKMSPAHESTVKEANELFQIVHG